MKPESIIKLVVLAACSVLLSSCATSRGGSGGIGYSADYSSRIPQTIATNEPTIVVDPRVHTWGAYNSDGQLVKAGLASAGRDWCPDTGKPCRTHSGTYRIQSLGGPECVSHIFPIGVGGSPMPYCMFFSGGQALHGVPPNEIGEGNYSHGCVRLQVSDAEWIRYDFAGVGTKVIVRPY